MKILTVIFLAIFLSLGCTVNSEYWNSCEVVCEKNEGIKSVNKFHGICVCNNGAKFYESVSEDKILF